MSRQIQRSAAKRPPPRNTRNIIIYATLAVIVIGAIVAVALASRVPQVASTAPEAPAAIKVGDKAPDFSAATNQGPFTLSAVKGKPVFLEIFATWCPHCQRMTSVIDKLYARYKDKVQFLAVSGSQFGIDGSTPETQADVVAWATKFNVTYPVAFDSDLTVAKLYSQAAFPTIVIIEKSGTISDIETGELTSDYLAKKLDKALSS